MHLYVLRMIMFALAFRVPQFCLVLCSAEFYLRSFFLPDLNVLEDVNSKWIFTQVSHEIKLLSVLSADMVKSQVSFNELIIN